MKKKVKMIWMVLMVLITMPILSFNTLSGQKSEPHLIYVIVTNNSLLADCNARICINYDGYLGNIPVSGSDCLPYSADGNYVFEMTSPFQGVVCPSLINDCGYVAESVSCVSGFLGKTEYISFTVGGDPIE